MTDPTWGFWLVGAFGAGVMLAVAVCIVFLGIREAWKYYRGR